MKRNVKTLEFGTILLLTTLNLCLLSAVTALTSRRLDPNIIDHLSLRDPDTHELITNINNARYFNNSVYIGAENMLVRLDAQNLRILQYVRTGPVLDSPLCRYNPREECLYSRRKSLVSNFNKLLLVMEREGLLLTCWTAYQGVCEMRSLVDIERIVVNSSVAVVANDPVNSTIAFQATSPNSQRLLYVATTYTSLGAYRDDIPALSGRSLQTQSKFMHLIESNNQLKTVKSSIDFVSRFRKSFIVKYIAGFNLGLHNYYLSVQHADTDALLNNHLLSTKISRLCLNDLSFTKSYTELGLKCSSGSRGSISSLRSIDYNELLASKLVEIENEFYLIGLFQQTGRTNFNMSLDLPNVATRQAICVFPMKSVAAKIHENINRCYNSDLESQVMRGLNFIKPDQRCSYNSRRSNSADDYCASSADNGLYPIGGNIPLQTNSIIEFDTASQQDKYAVLFDSMQFVEKKPVDNNNKGRNVLILMSNLKQEMRFFSMGSIFNEPEHFRTVNLNIQDEDANLAEPIVKIPLTNMELVDNKNSLLVISKSNVFKVELDSCSSFKTCQQCVQKSPHCGWCGFECTTRGQCSSPSNAWLSLNESSMTDMDSICVDVTQVEPQQKFKYDNEWVEVTFKRDLEDIAVGNSSYECVYRSDDVASASEEMRTDAVKIGPKKLKCALPHSSKIKFGPLTEQTLELSTDGLFRVSPSNKYYYEQNLDQVQLGLHIQNSQSRQTFGLASTSSKPLFNVTLIDCNMHKSCISCLSQSQCKWCSNKCSNPLETAPTSEAANVCQNDASNCANFDTGTSKLLIPFTAHRQQAPLLFALYNYIPDTVGGGAAGLECMFTLFNGKSIGRNLSVPYQQVNATHANCQLNAVFGVLSEQIEQHDGQVQTNLRLYDAKRDVFVDSNLNGKLALLFYKCEMKASDCSQCLSVNPQLSCMWCQANAAKASCRFMNAQSKLAQLSQCISPQLLTTSNANSTLTTYQCDKPQVDLIEPTKLPIGGGTVLAIYGNNLGTRFDDLIDVHLVCAEQVAIKCDLIEKKYLPSKQVWCEARASLIGVQSGCKVVVKLRASSSVNAQLNPAEYIYVTSSQLVDYVDPIINDIEPKQVIQSAKYVWLTISGIDLDAGRFRSIQIIDYPADSTQPGRTVKCEIKNSTSRQIRCRLNDKFEQLGKKNLKLNYDKSMTVLNYLSLRVHSDPLVKAIDSTQTIFSGGTSFKLNGFSFDSVQSVYTYVSYRSMWYSEPIQARNRISNELIEFDFPALNEGFQSLVRQQQQQLTAASKYELEIGFLMDGFNVTLKDLVIEYRQNPTKDELAVVGVQIEMQNAGNESQFSLMVDLKMDRSVYAMFYSGLIRDNLQVFIGCSLCTNQMWLNETRFSCQLPSLNQKIASNHLNSTQTATCDSKVYALILSKLNQNRLSLVNFLLGNLEISAPSLDENLKIYMQTYTLNNVDNFLQIAQRLSQQTTNSHLINKILQNQYKTSDNNFFIESLTSQSSSSKNLLLISSIIGTMLIVLIVFTVVLVSIVIRIKRRNRKLDGGGCGSSNAMMMDQSMQKFRLSRKMVLTGGGTAKKRSEKHLKHEFELIQKQIDLLELQIRGKCAMAYQQLHQDYVNELNNELIYNVYSMPIWNYGTYLLNCFCGRIDLGLGEQLMPQMVMMSSSSMSNSTTNTLLSQQQQQQQQQHQQSQSQQLKNMPQQQQQQPQIQAPLNSTMSVYATIKSSSMLRFDALDTSDQQNRHQFMAYGNIGEAMQLFDQLLHNKNFLLTFLNTYSFTQTKHSPADNQILCSLISLSLRDNLPYLYSIIKSLLSDHIRKSLATQQSSSGSGGGTKSSKFKSLFRDNEFHVVECLISNWISMFMYDFQRDTQCSTHLYRLVRVIGHYLDSAPCDAVQGVALNSLNEDKLLWDLNVQYQMLYVNFVMNQGGKGLFVVPLVDLDTVEQAKEKCIEVVNRQGGFSALGQKPTTRDIDLELCLIIIPNDQAQTPANTSSTLITLKDTEEELINQNGLTPNSTKRLLILKDYNIQNGSFINISFKPHILAHQKVHQDQQHVYMSTMSMSNEYQVYASGPTAYQTKPVVPLPLTPPPSLIQNRYHLQQPKASTVSNDSNHQFSTTGSNSSADTQSSMISKQSTKKKSSSSSSSNSSKKKYEKLLTVKSQDSAVTTASLITNESAKSLEKPSKTAILTRLLMNKGTVQPFIDQFLESIFLNSANLPPIVQHLFEFVDAELKKYNPEPKNLDDLLKLSRTWKTSILFLRYWTQLIKNPDIIFDCKRTSLLDSSLDCISQAFIDSCSSLDAHNLYDTNSPTNRLLFIREVPRYKLMIDQFYSDLKLSQQVTDHELHFYLNEFTKMHPSTAQTEINHVQVLAKCYSLYEKCESQCNQALGQQQCSILLPVHHRLVQIKDLMSNTASSTVKTPSYINNGTATINPNYLNQYQQGVVNAYATASDICISLQPQHLTHHQNFHHQQQQQYF